MVSFVELSLASFRQNWSSLSCKNCAHAVSECSLKNFILRFKAPSGWIKGAIESLGRLKSSNGRPFWALIEITFSSWTVIHLISPSWSITSAHSSNRKIWTIVSSWLGYLGYVWGYVTVALVFLLFINGVRYWLFLFTFYCYLTGAGLTVVYELVFWGDFLRLMNLALFVCSVLTVGLRIRADCPLYYVALAISSLDKYLRRMPDFLLDAGYGVI